jgi:two-component system, chemotaxis family, chemotaxis protein CheY
MKQKILIVENSKAIRFLLKTIFGKKYEVVLVEDGCSAIQWLSKKKLPDLIIADTQLSDMRNWELIEYLKSSGSYGDIPLIALSSLDKFETRLICEDLRIEKFFVKPFNPIDLQHAVKQLIASEYEKTSSLTLQRQLEYLQLG